MTSQASRLRSVGQDAVILNETRVDGLVAHLQSMTAAS